LKCFGIINYIPKLPLTFSNFVYSLPVFCNIVCPLGLG
jgi:hypothetical protein